MACAALSAATEIVLKNDTYQPGAGYSYFYSWEPGDEAGAFLRSPVSGTIVAVQLLWLSPSGGRPDRTEEGIRIYEGNGFPGPTLARIEEPTLVDGQLNEIRYLDPARTKPLRVPVVAGQEVIVAIRFANAQMSGDPTIGVDDACTSYVNGLCVPALGGCWSCDPCVEGLPGDFVIRAIVDDAVLAGACCFPSGDCATWLTPSRCAFAGGTYLGNGTNCPACVQPPEDYVVGMGLGQPNPNRVRGFSSAGTEVLTFDAYASGQWGVNVATAELYGPYEDYVLTGPGPGPIHGPQVRGFNASGGPLAKVSFYAYATLKYGVNVASGHVDGDVYEEILTGAGPGAVFGPHVRGFNFDGSGIGAIPGLNYFAYATPKYGVTAGSGSVDGDGFAEILTGPGPSAAFGPTVRGWDYDGARIAAISKINFDAFAGPRSGALVAGGDVDSDGFDEIAAAPGPGVSSPASARGFDYDGATIAPLAGYDVTPFTTSYGARVALGDVSMGGGDELCLGPGPDPIAATTAMSFGYNGTKLLRIASFSAFPGFLYGVNVVPGNLRYSFRERLETAWYRGSRRVAPAGRVECRRAKEP